MEAKMNPVKNMTALKQRYPKKVHATPNMKYSPHIVAETEIQKMKPVQKS